MKDNFTTIKLDEPAKERVTMLSEDLRQILDMANAHKEVFFIVRTVNGVSAYTIKKEAK